jgi:hypothetical protein
LGDEESLESIVPGSWGHCEPVEGAQQTPYYGWVRLS